MSRSAVAIAGTTFAAFSAWGASLTIDCIGAVSATCFGSGWRLAFAGFPFSTAPFLLGVRGPAALGTATVLGAVQWGTLALIASCLLLENPVARQRRTLLALSGILGLAILAFWSGEGLDEPLPSVWLGIVAIGAAAGTACLIPVERLPTRAATFVGLLGVGSAAWLVGTESGGHALNECVSQGEVVREELARFHREHGSYPSSLDELPAEVPCDRALRPSLLEYERRGDGYTLRFSDWLVDHVASDEEPFLAHK